MKERFERLNIGSFLYINMKLPVVRKTDIPKLKSGAYAILGTFGLHYPT